MVSKWDQWDIGAFCFRIKMGTVSLRSMFVCVCVCVNVGGCMCMRVCVCMHASYCLPVCGCVRVCAETCEWAGEVLRKHHDSSWSVCVCVCVYTETCEWTGEVLCRLYDISAFCLKLKTGKVSSRSMFACAETCEWAGEVLRKHHDSSWSVCVCVYTETCEWAGEILCRLHEMQRGPAATENHWRTLHSGCLWGKRLAGAMPGFTVSAHSARLRQKVPRVLTSAYKYLQLEFAK